jgi:hypothetical protein
MTTAPGFLTNHELDRFLGGGDAGQRQRQRLRRDHLLPAPADLGKVRRFNIVLFPRFALAGLVRDLARIPHGTDTMAAVTEKALGSAAFAEVGAAVRESARALSDWSFNALVQGVVERAADAVREWDEVVVGAEHELAERLGISFSTEPGVIEGVRDNICLVALDAGRVEHVPFARVAAQAEKGCAVALVRVNVLSKELGYVIPLEAAVDNEDNALATWFEQMAAPVPAQVVTTDAHVSNFEPLPYRRSGPCRARWHGASTMTRVPADV